MEWGLAVVGAAAGTYFLRAAPFAFKSLRHAGERYLHFLTYVSFAVAAGIVAKVLLISGGKMQFDADLSIKLTALLCALVLQRVSRNVPTSLFGGVATAALLKWLLG